MVFGTRRLTVRRADVSDAGLYLELWNDPAVMANVGFPEGLGTTEGEVLEKIGAGTDEFDSLLVAVRARDGIRVGECRMHLPDGDGVASTDIKLLPRFQGLGYGTELKLGLLDRLFRTTDCRAVRATPNVGNAASVGMQEKVGGVRVAEDVFRFRRDMGVPTTPVHHYVYLVSRSDWESRRPSEAGGR
ncbi:MAG: GNAT family N-acetyltransferase [Candidatus Fermentibacteraceae bacterium]